MSKVNDEIHFITECPLYTNLRKELLGPYTDKNKANLQLFQAFFQSEDTPTLSKLANFIFKANCVRELNTSAHIKHNIKNTIYKHAGMTIPRDLNVF